MSCATNCSLRRYYTLCIVSPPSVRTVDDRFPSPRLALRLTLTFQKRWRSSSKWAEANDLLILYYYRRLLANPRVEMAGTSAATGLKTASASPYPCTALHFHWATRQVRRLAAWVRSGDCGLCTKWIERQIEVLRTTRTRRWGESLPNINSLNWVKYSIMGCEDRTDCCLTVK